MRRLVLALAVAAIALTACASEPAATSSDTGFVAGDGSVVLLDPAERVTAPAISGTTLDGDPWSSQEALGDVLVLNVWASWCAPCRAEAPDLQSAWVATEADGVQFVGLNTRDSDAAARAYVERFGITFPSVVDTDGTIQLQFRDTLPPQAIPSTLVIDRRGRVAARFLGVVDETTLTTVVRDVAAESA